MPVLYDKGGLDAEVTKAVDVEFFTTPIQHDALAIPKVSTGKPSSLGIILSQTVETNVEFTLDADAGTPHWSDINKGVALPAGTSFEFLIPIKPRCTDKVPWRRLAMAFGPIGVGQGLLRVWLSISI